MRFNSWPTECMLTNPLNLKYRGFRLAVPHSDKKRTC
jgi:hypothetical protein